nr:MAG TPA: hypothetical protein [Caudoviricetes sp.]
MQSRSIAETNWKDNRAVRIMIATIRCSLLSFDDTSIPQPTKEVKGFRENFFRQIHQKCVWKIVQIAY